MDGADYIMRLAEDSDLLQRMSRAARELVEARYSFERIAHRLQRLYVGAPPSHS